MTLTNPDKKKLLSFLLVVWFLPVLSFSSSSSSSDQAPLDAANQQKTVFFQWVSLNLKLSGFEFEEPLDIHHFSDGTHLAALIEHLVGQKLAKVRIFLYPPLFLLFYFLSDTKPLTFYDCCCLTSRSPPRRTDSSSSRTATPSSSSSRIRTSDSLCQAKVCPLSLFLSFSVSFLSQLSLMIFFFFGVVMGK